MPRIIDVEDLIAAAKEHGMQSEPDHEVGDLQMLLRSAFNKLSEEAQGALIDEHAELLEWLDAEPFNCGGRGCGLATCPTCRRQGVV